MTAAHSGPLILSFRGASAGRIQDSPKLPNADDIHDLTRQMLEITDALSRLLLNDTKWRKGRSSEQRTLALKRSVEQFCDFCKATVALLQTFSTASKRFTTLFGSILVPEPYKSIEQYAGIMRTEMQSISTRISSVEQHYTKFTSPFSDLLRMAPPIYRRPRDLDKDREIFQRLDAFWKVVATQLSNVLERRSEFPHPDISRNAMNGWSEYELCLLHEMNALTQSYDALMVSSNGLEAYRQKGISLPTYLKKGLKIIWSKLTRQASQRSREYSGVTAEE